MTEPLTCLMCGGPKVGFYVCETCEEKETVWWPLAARWDVDHPEARCTHCNGTGREPEVSE